LSLIPSIRADYYKLDPRNDAIYADDNPGIEPHLAASQHRIARHVLSRATQSGWNRPQARINDE